MTIRSVTRSSTRPPGRARPHGRCRCPRTCVGAWTRRWRTWRTSRPSRLGACWSQACSCGNSYRTGSVGHTWTLPGPRSTAASRTATRPGAERARQYGLSSRWLWTSRMGGCRHGQQCPGNTAVAQPGLTDQTRSVLVADSGGYDIVILGGGSGGYACALRSAELGKRVALIEKGKVGGTCLHRGCIPTKALLHAAEVADQARESASFGIRATLEGVDMAGVNAYKDKVVTRLWKGLVGLIGSRHIDVIEGEGRLVSPTQLQVGDTLIEGAQVVLASGSQARSLPGLEIDGRRVITSDHALELDRVPASVVILGGGVIGAGV